MKKILSFILFITLNNVINAQWIWQNPLPTGNLLLGLHFISSTTGWAVGDGGTILKTANGGLT